MDIGRGYLDVGLAPSGRTFRQANEARGIEAVIERLRREGASRVILESIGGYGARLVRALARAGFEVGVVDPKRIRALRIAEGKKAKTDRLDAKLIARFALIMEDAARPVPTRLAFEIKALSTRRRQIVEMAAMEKTRLKQTLDEAVAVSCRAIIDHLERTRIEDGSDAQRSCRPGKPPAPGHLQRRPGRLTLLADMPELGGLNRKSAASLAGLAPHADESGTRTGAAHISGGGLASAPPSTWPPSAVRTGNGASARNTWP